MVGLKFNGGPSVGASALIPASATFNASGPSSNRRPRRVHINLRNGAGGTVGVAASVPFYISNSSLGTSPGRTSALSSGTIAASIPIAIDSDGGLEVTQAGISGVITCETSGHVRLNLSHTSLANRNVFLVLLFAGGQRSISSSIIISS